MICRVFVVPCQVSKIIFYLTRRNYSFLPFKNVPSQIKTEVDDKHLATQLRFKRNGVKGVCTKKEKESMIKN